MSLILFGIFLFLSFLIASFVWKSKEKSFLSKEEVNRCINNNCSVNNSWSPNGRVYTEGFVIIKDDSNETKFIKQTKLCDIGTLD